MVLGNHEFNAVAYATVHPVQFDYCREHSSKHWRQYREFLEEVELGSPCDPLAAYRWSPDQTRLTAKCLIAA